MLALCTSRYISPWTTCELGIDTIRTLYPLSTGMYFPRTNTFFHIIAIQLSPSRNLTWIYNFSLIYSTYSNFPNSPNTVPRSLVFCLIQDAFKGLALHLVACLNLDWFSSLLEGAGWRMFFMAVSIQMSCFVGCPSIWICLIVSAWSDSVKHFWLECCVVDFRSQVCHIRGTSCQFHYWCKFGHLNKVVSTRCILQRGPFSFVINK